jgi:hypothetical protein
MNVRVDRAGKYQPAGSVDHFMPSDRQSGADLSYFFIFDKNIRDVSVGCGYKLAIANK